jgi:hypothetical protein
VITRSAAKVEQTPDGRRILTRETAIELPEQADIRDDDTSDRDVVRRHALAVA